MVGVGAVIVLPGRAAVVVEVAAGASDDFWLLFEEEVMGVVVLPDVEET